MRNPFRLDGALSLRGGRGEKALTGSPEISSLLASGWNAYPLLGGGSRQRIADVYNRAQNATYAWMYQNSPAVRTVVDTIVRNVGQLDLRLYEEISHAERQPAPDHPAALSLRYPTEDVSADKFVREMFKDFLIYDNAYALITPAADDQVSLVRIPAHMMMVMGDTLFTVQNYRVWPMGAWTTAGSFGGGGTPVDFPPDQIMHWHGENPLDPRIGLSMLDTIRDVVAEDAALQQAIVELAQNGLQEPVWISRPLDAPPLSNEAAAGLEEDMRNRLRRRNEKPPMLEEGMALNSFGMSPNDAQMLQLRQWATKRVASLYGMPLGMVGLDENVAAARQEFLTDTLPPYCGDFTSMLNQRILARVYDEMDYCFEFNLDEKSMNADDRLVTLTSAAGVPILTRNEARAKINLPPVDGGDEPITPLNVISGDNPKPSPQTMPIQDPNKPPQDGSYRQGDGPTPVPSSEPQKALKATEFTPLPQLLPSRDADIERQRRNIDVFQGVVQKHYNRLQRSLSSRTDKTPDWDRWDREFSDDLDEALKRVVQAEGDVYAFKLVAANFEMADVQHYLRAMAEGVAGAVNETIRGDVDQRGIDDAMARAPQHVASVSRSVGTRATIWAREEAARQSGTSEQRVKTWIADSDRHAELNGQTVALTADWPNGFAPGSEPGCACSMSIS